MLVGDAVLESSRTGNWVHVARDGVDSARDNPTIIDNRSELEALKR
jgi:hypothetical protein